MEGNVASPPIQQAKHATAARIASGPLQIGDDWPGVFIRGDEAAGLYGALRWALDEIGRANGKRPACFDQLMRWCEGCWIDG